MSPTDDSIVQNEPPWLWKGTVPSLNGLRAFSITIVILSHVFEQAKISPGYLPISGSMGVEVFFVISGFLITLLLIREQQRKGRISIRNFYVRRALRIFPAYFFFLGCIAILSSYGLVALTSRQLLIAATYTTNLFAIDNWVVGHTWSLCVEEHFYLIWPLLFIGCGRSRASWLAVAYICLTPFLRVLLRYLFPEVHHLGNFTLVRMDAIAMGCCLAIVATAPELRRYLEWTPAQGNLVRIGCALFLVVSHQIAHRYQLTVKPVAYYFAFLGGTVNALVITALIWSCVWQSEGLIGKCLNSSKMVYIGILSYSLYLWQQPFTDPHRVDWLNQSPCNLILLAVCALGSYYVIERPFLGLKQKLAPE